MPRGPRSTAVGENNHDLPQLVGRALASLGRRQCQGRTLPIRNRTCKLKFRSWRPACDAARRKEIEIAKKGATGAGRSAANLERPSVTRVGVADRVLVGVGAELPQRRGSITRTADFARVSVLVRRDCTSSSGSRAGAWPNTEIRGHPRPRRSVPSPSTPDSRAAGHARRFERLIRADVQGGHHVRTPRA